MGKNWSIPSLPPPVSPFPLIHGNLGSRDRRLAALDEADRLKYGGGSQERKGRSVDSVLAVCGRDF